MMNNANDNFDKRKKVIKRKINKVSYCNNCGNYGHQFKQCGESIISFGVINIRVQLESINNSNFEQLLLNNHNKKGIDMNHYNSLQAFCYLKDKIHFLLIRRKHTLGYMEFVRGHYRVDNVDGIVFLFRQMTQEEINKIGQSDFDDLWRDLWNNLDENDAEYNASKKKFNQLVNDDELNLNFYVKNVAPRYNTPEWGFPKGRRNFKESNLDCAAREFEEETNLIPDNYSVLKNIDPYEEEFIGTNGVKYKHVYYIAYSHINDELKINRDNVHQSNEIGDIGWFTYEEAANMIRPYHAERKKLLTKLYINVENALINHLTGVTKDDVNEEVEIGDTDEGNQEK